MKKLFISFKHLSRALLVLTSLLAITTFAFSQNFEINKLNLTDSTGSSIMLFLEDIPDEFLIKYGIKDKSEIRKATIGNPIAIYTIENNGLLFTNTWRIPLIIDNEYRALFTIFKNVNDEYKIVDFGAKLLAEEIHRFSKDSAFVAILRVYELKKDYYINETNDGEIRFQPIPNDGIRQYNFNDLIQMIK